MGIINIIGIGVVILAATNISTRVRKHSMAVDGKTYSMAKYSVVCVITAVVFSLIYAMIMMNANNGSKLIHYTSASFIILLYCISFLLAKKKIVFEDKYLVIESIFGNNRIEYTDIIKCTFKENRYLYIQTATHTTKVTDVFPTDEFARLLKKKNVKIDRESSLKSFDVYYPLDGKIVLLILYYGSGIACFAGTIYLIDNSLINIWAILFLVLVGLISILKGIDFQIKKIRIEGDRIISKSLLKTKNISFYDVNCVTRTTDEKGYEILTLYNCDNKKIIEVGKYLINFERFEQVLKSRNIKIK
ncbi:MAG: hypothetical protein K6B41_06280 [Butyrivibrio sp.]|nr:hypothetical protein [Butyrivibrio sp.]